VSSRIPLFPLNTVLVPGLVMPLHIFEPRYRAMIEMLLEIPNEDEREFGIVAVRDGADPRTVDGCFPIGTATVLRQAQALDDGRYDIMTTGSRRFRIVHLDASEPLLYAEVEWLDDITSQEDALLAQHTAKAFTAYRSILGGQLTDESDADIDDLPDDPTVLSYLITAAMVLPHDERQLLLAADDTATRLRTARSLLHRENMLIAALGAVPAIELTSTTPSVN
jgi:Lon protease-like protein